MEHDEQKQEGEPKTAFSVEQLASPAISMTGRRAVEKLLRTRSAEERREYALVAITAARFCMIMIRDAIKAILKGIDLRSVPNNEPRGLIENGILSRTDRKIKALLGPDAFAYFLADPFREEIEECFDEFENTYLRLQGDRLLRDPSIDDGQILRGLAEAAIFSTAASRKLSIPALRSQPKFREMFEHPFSKSAITEKGLHTNSSNLLPHP